MRQWISSAPTPTFFSDRILDIALGYRVGSPLLLKEILKETRVRCPGIGNNRCRIQQRSMV